MHTGRCDGCQFYTNANISEKAEAGSGHTRAPRQTHVLGRDDPGQLVLVLQHQLVPPAEPPAPLLGRDKAAVAAARREAAPLANSRSAGEAGPRKPAGPHLPARPPPARGPPAAIFRRRSPWRGGGPRRRRLRVRPARPPAPRPARSRPPGPAPRRWPGPARGKRRASLASGRPPGRPGAPGRRAAPSYRAAPPQDPGPAGGEGGGGGGRRQSAAAGGSPWPCTGDRRRSPERARLHRPGGGAAPQAASRRSWAVGG